MLEKRRETINKKIKELQEELESLRAQRTNIVHYNGGTEFSDTRDMELDRQLYFTELTLRELQNVLANMVTEVIDNDTVQIGSTFNFTLNDLMTKDVTLVKELSSVDRAGFITLNSPMGAAVIGKKEGEAFSYIVNDPRTKITTEYNGVINQIYKKDIGTSKIKK